MPHRFRAAAAAAILLPAALLAPAARAADRASAPQPTNVVLIIGDDQGWTDYGFMGHPHVRTPRLDRLAAEGLVFPRGYVPSSLCRPSLATMITGLFPHQHSITSNDPPLPKDQSGLPPGENPEFLALREKMIARFELVPALPRLLADLGYASFQSGKWWEGHHCRCGFTAGMTHGDPGRGGRHGDLGLSIGREGLEPIVSFIDESVAAGRPFFIWYAPFMPHSPHTPPARILEHYTPLTDSPFVARYWAMCEWFDETCGELVDYLDGRGLGSQTLVIFLCDNGWIQDPAAERFAPRSKRSPYDGGVRTPFVLRWTGMVAPGVSPSPVSSIDLAPTVLAAVGLPPLPDMQGVNLLDGTAIARRRTIFGEIFTHNAVDVDLPASSLLYRYAVDDQWKLIAPASRALAGNLELYRIQEDPRESRNLAADHPDVAARLLAAIDEWWPAEGAGDAPPDD